MACQIDKHERARLEARAKVFKALAHPTRLFIVDQLTHGECCVRELAEMVGADISTVSRHLSLLKSVGAISDEKRGSQVYYRLQMPCVLGFFECVEAVIQTAAEEQMDLAAPRCTRTGLKR
ncbi:MAG: transcriptional regulator [Candidatus Riflebacteria bacterium RBG_13_59_9]|nr:MAG: transcriptional regulator [Candidatus Riflebacteria bacterium RBG_13_59_9]